MQILPPPVPSPNPIRRLVFFDIDGFSLCGQRVSCRDRNQVTKTLTNQSDMSALAQNSQKIA